MKKSVVHFEIGCANLAETTAFYQKIFNWSMITIGDAAYIDTGKEGAIPGHINQLSPEEPQQYITVYIETDELERDIEAAVANGGAKMVDPIKLPDGRTFAWIKDPAGNMLGLITPSI